MKIQCPHLHREILHSLPASPRRPAHQSLRPVIRTHSSFVLGRRGAAECSERLWAEVVWTPSRPPRPSHWHLTPQGPGRLCQMMYQGSRAPREPWSESHGSQLWPTSWRECPCWPPAIAQGEHTTGEVGKRTLSTVSLMPTLAFSCCLLSMALPGRV